MEKQVGETCLAALERVRASDPALRGVPMTYAGRLDPMASGQLLILIGDECKDRAHYDGLDKSYEFEVLLGASSDTGDVLGLAELGEPVSVSDVAARAAVESMRGAHELPYPAFSSRTVAGKPLYQWALEARLDEIQIPTARMAVRSIEYRDSRSIDAAALLRDIEAKLALLHTNPEDTRLGSDFRKPQILMRWRALLTGVRAFTILSCAADVASGTYIRALAPKIAERLGTAGLAYAIHRTRITLPL